MADEEQTCAVCCYYTYYGCQVPQEPLSKNSRALWAEGAAAIKKHIFPIFPRWACYYWLFIQLALALLGVLLSAVSYGIRETNEASNVIQLVMVSILAYGTIFHLVILGFTSCGLLNTESFKYFDPVNNVAFELLLYPAVIASITDVLHNRHYEFSATANIVSFAAAVVVGVLYVFSAYLIRIMLVGTVVYRLAKKIHTRKLKYTYFLVYLCFNVIVQAVVQVLLFALIGVRLQAENGSISSFLWAMFVLGEALPLAGIFAYFITTHKYVEEFPMDYNSNENTDRNPYECIHPFFSPVQVLLCALLAFLIVVFFLCFSLTLQDSGEVAGTLFGFYSNPDSDYFSIIVTLFSLALGITILVNCFPLVVALFGLLAVLAFPLVLVVCLGCATGWIDYGKCKCCGVCSKACTNDCLRCTVDCGGCNFSDWKMCNCTCRDRSLCHDCSEACIRECTDCCKMCECGKMCDVDCGCDCDFKGCVKDLCNCKKICNCKEICSCSSDNWLILVLCCPCLLIAAFAKDCSLKECCGSCFEGCVECIGETIAQYCVYILILGFLILITGGLILVPLLGILIILGLGN